MGGGGGRGKIGDRGIHNFLIICGLIRRGRAMGIRDVGARNDGGNDAGRLLEKMKNRRIQGRMWGSGWARKKNGSNSGEWHCKRGCIGYNPLR